MELEIPSSDVTEQPADLLGGRIRALRKSHGYTLDSLAREVDLTKGYLSKVETGQRVPPIGTLSRIAQALDIELASLIELGEPKASRDRSKKGISLVRSTERKVVVRGASSFGYDCQSLIESTAGWHMTPFLFTFPQQILKEVVFQHAGEEFLFVLSGILEFEVNGEMFELEPGDCLYIDTSQPHRGRGKNSEAKAIVVIYEPSEHP